MPLDILFIFMYNSTDRSLLYLFETCIKEPGATCRGKLEPGMPQETYWKRSQVMLREPSS